MDQVLEAESRIPEPDDVDAREIENTVESSAPDHIDSAQVAEEEIVIADAVVEQASSPEASSLLKAIIEAAIYITDEPLSVEQIATAVEQPREKVEQVLKQLVAEYSAPDRGLSVRELAGGYQMATKPEHHEAIRRFVNKLQPPLKLSLAALETLAVVAYKQPITGPEIMDIRGVQGAGVLKTLLDRRLIAAAGRKNVLGKPMMYKTTREFLIQFGLNSLAELPTLKEFEELARFSLSDGEEEDASAAPSSVTGQEISQPRGEQLVLEPEAKESAEQLPPVTGDTDENA
ncbi:MAG: SMC-Scp complex subunit ScpB [Acidobacteriota bacterium]|nr:SMC-Scp complex subunit ScpB [Acidobacteriota bacterium]